MTLSEIKEKQKEMQKMHKENQKRINKDVSAQGVMMGGIALTMLGGILTATTAGIFPLILSCVGFVSGVAGWGTHIGLEHKDKKAVKQLHEQYPEIVEKPNLMSDYAMIYSRKVMEHLDDLEFGATQEQIQEEVKEKEETLQNSMEHQIDTSLQKISLSDNKEDEIGE